MLHKEQALLTVIDVQDVLMPHDHEIVEAYLRQVNKLIQAAHILQFPILVTEQYPEKLGITTECVLKTLGDTPRLPKIEFGCLANAAFVAQLKNARRKQLLLVGMETHVCVLQTALEALEQGYEVYVVVDAVVSRRKSEYSIAMNRMRGAGVCCVSTEMALFELLRKSGTPEFKAMLPLVKE